MRQVDERQVVVEAVQQRRDEVQQQQLIVYKNGFEYMRLVSERTQR